MCVGVGAGWMGWMKGWGRGIGGLDEGGGGGWIGGLDEGVGLGGGGGGVGDGLCVSVFDVFVGLCIYLQLVC